MKITILFSVVLLSWQSYAQEIVVNEILARNNGIVKNKAGKSFDYVELFNSSKKSVDVSGYFLSDNKDSLKMYTIPSGTKISAKGFLVFWANGDIKEKELNTNFKLSQKGETVFLSYPNGSLCHSLKYKRQFADVSFGLLPTGEKDYLTPTPGNINKQNRIFVADIKGKMVTKVALTTNINNYSVKLQNPNNETATVKILDSKTDKVLYKTKLESSSATIHFSAYENGKFKLLIGKDTYRILKK